MIVNYKKIFFRINKNHCNILGNFKKKKNFLNNRLKNKK